MSASAIAADRVKEKTAAAQSGTGTFNLSETAETGYQSFAGVFSSGDLVEYVIEGETAGEWEHGIGTYTAATPDTLARTTVLAGSNGTSAVNFTSGQHTVFVSPGARTLNRLTLPVTTHAPTTAAATMVWNRTNQVDVSGLTASRNLTIPTPAAGDRLAIEITTGDDSFAGIVIGDTGIDVGGAGAATEWSRLFITGERLLLKARSATVVDIEDDGRIPQKCRLHRTGVTTGSAFADAAWTEIPFSSGAVETYDVGDIGDLTNSRIVVRRKGTYRISAQLHTTSTLTSITTCGIRIEDDQGTSVTWFRGNQVNANGVNNYVGGLTLSGEANVTDLTTAGANAFRVMAFQDSAGAGEFFGDSTGAFSWLSVTEILE